MLHRVREGRNIPHTVNSRKANWIGHMLRRNWLIKHVIQGKTEERISATGGRGRRRKQLLCDVKESRGYSQLKEEALDCPVWRTCFGIDYEAVVKRD